MLRVVLALTVVPGTPGSARLDPVPEPERSGGDALVETVAVGLSETDREIVNGSFGTAPPGEARLVLAHESVGRVLEAPLESGLEPGDLVAAIVRQPDPVPCPSCAAGEWDMCRNGLYTEHGIRGLHGFARERFRIDSRFLVRLPSRMGVRGVLLEPASRVAKAWESVEYIGSRTRWEPRRVLVAGAGPIGLLAALQGVQRGLEVHVYDRVAEAAQRDRVTALGAAYHGEGPESLGASDDHARGPESLGPFDVVLECTGAPDVVLACLRATASDGIVCLTAVSAGGRTLPLAAAATGRDLVLENVVVFGCVSSNRTHYQQAAVALERADPEWLDSLITRRVPLDRWSEALERTGDLETVILFG